MAPRLSLTFWCDYLNGWQSSTTKDPCFSSYILDDSFIFSQQTPAPACESYEIFPTICLLITIYLSWVGGSFKFSTMYSCRMRNSQLYDECKTHSKGFGTAMRMSLSRGFQLCPTLCQGINWVQKRVQTFYKHQHTAQNFPNLVMCRSWFFVLAS